MSHEIYSLEWEYEDQLPEISDLEYDLMFEYSEIKDGVRMFPFITLYKSNGEPYRIYLGA
jgi:hypothetical protein